MWLADQLGLDLVEVAPSADPPVCRLMDYGKYKYELSVKSREARKNQTKTVIKEVKFKPKIGDHDYQIKRNQVLKFLAHGDRVKITIWFRGREMSRPELGLKIIDRLVEEIGEAAKIEQAPKQEGRNMHMVLVPVRRAKVETQEDATADPTTEAATAEPAKETDAMPEPPDTDAGGVEERSS